MTQKQLEPHVPNWVRCREDREDIAADAYLRVKLKGIDYFPYAVKTAERVACDYKRKAKVKKRNYNAKVNLDLSSVMECLEIPAPAQDLDLRLDIDMFLLNFEDREIEAFQLVADGFGLRGAAKEMGITWGAFRGLFYRAQKKARILAGIESNMVD